MNLRTRTIVVVAACVLALHVAAMWALQVGVMNRKPEIGVPVHLLARIVDSPTPVAPAPQPVVDPEPTVPKPTPPVRKAHTPKPAAALVGGKSTPPKPEPTIPAPEPAPAPAPAPAPRPMPSVAAATTPPVMPAAPAAVGTGKPTLPRATAERAPAPVGTVASAPASPPPRPAPPAVELPSSDAQYLQNPRPRYPPISWRLREQGTVLVEVLVSEQGLAKEARVQSSSGFFRLDSVAVSTVLTWRFVPGKRDGVAQSMWFIVPIEFAIQ